MNFSYTEFVMGMMKSKYGDGACLSGLSGFEVFEVNTIVTDSHR
jgi:hypothetical protein